MFGFFKKNEDKQEDKLFIFNRHFKEVFAIIVYYTRNDPVASKKSIDPLEEALCAACLVANFYAYGKILSEDDDEIKQSYQDIFYFYVHISKLCAKMVLDSANEQLDEDDVIESLLTELQERSKRYIQTVLDVMNYYNLSNIVHFDLGNLISNDLYEENCNDFNFSKKIFNNLISLS